MASYKPTDDTAGGDCYVPDFNTGTLELCGAFPRLDIPSLFIAYFFFLLWSDDEGPRLFGGVTNRRAL